MKVPVEHCVQVIVQDSRIANENPVEIEGIVTKAQIKTQAELMLAQAKMQNMKAEEIQELAYMDAAYVFQQFNEE